MKKWDDKWLNEFSKEQLIFLVQTLEKEVLCPAYGRIGADKEMCQHADTVAFNSMRAAAKEYNDFIELHDPFNCDSETLKKGVAIEKALNKAQRLSNKFRQRFKAALE